MFDEKKIIYTRQRASKACDKKTNVFLNKLSEDAMQRLGIDKARSFSILEILPTSNIFVKTLEKEKTHCDVYKTFFSSEIKEDKKKLIINHSNLSSVEDEKFDFCISFFPIFTEPDLAHTLKSIKKVLKSNGKFLFLFFSSESCSELKSIFYNTFNTKAKEMFMPSPDILLLGNITNQLGYKNVVVDKTNFHITSNSPKDIWSFIRAIGASNCLLKRNKKTSSRNDYNKLCEKIKLFLSEDGRIINKVSINYLIGTK